MPNHQDARPVARLPAWQQEDAGASAGILIPICLPMRTNLDAPEKRCLYDVETPIGKPRTIRVQSSSRLVTVHLYEQIHCSTQYCQCPIWDADQQKRMRPCMPIPSMLIYGTLERGEQWRRHRHLNSPKHFKPPWSSFSHLALVCHQPLGEVKIVSGVGCSAEITLFFVPYLFQSKTPQARASRNIECEPSSQWLLCLLTGLSWSRPAPRDPVHCKCSRNHRFAP